MPAVWMRFGSELRARWRATLALALLVALVAGVAFAALAAARRTDSAFTRLVHETKAWDVDVNPDLGMSSRLEQKTAAVEHLPMVLQAGRVDGLYVTPVDLLDPASAPISLVGDGRVGYTFARFKMLHGRMPDPRRPDDVVVNPTLARRVHLRVGAPLRLVALSVDDVNAVTSGNVSPATIAADVRRGRLGRLLTVRVAGIGTTPDDIVVDQGFDLPEMLFTPAFPRAHPGVSRQYFGITVRLRRGERDLAEFERRVQAMAPNEALAFQSLNATSTKVDRAVRPQVGALTVFGVVVAITGVLVIGQALARQIALDAAEHPTLHALGFTRGQLVGVAMLRAAIVASGGAALAVVVGYLSSAFSPVGAARTAEPHPGLAADWFVLGLGALVVVAVVGLLALLPAWRASRSVGPDVATARAAVAPRLVAAAAGGAVSVPGLTGIRMALEPGRGRTAVPVRTTIVGAALAVAMVVAAVTFGASLDHLVHTPRLYGWNWDVHVNLTASDSDQQGDVNLVKSLDSEVRRTFDRSRALTRWSASSLSQLTVDRVTLPAVGVEPGASVAPTLVSGRMPRRDDEIALGARSQRALGVGTGDRVSVRDPAGATHTLHVVGRVILPGLGTYPGSDKTALGEGAVVTTKALAALGPNFQRVDYFLDFRAGASSAPTGALLRNLQQEVDRAIAASGGASTDVEVDHLQRPSDIVSYERVRSTPALLAAVLAVLALATVAHALVTTIRRRRRDFALLKTLGFTRRQVSASVAWQATTVALAAVVIGVPLGVVGGRWAWTVLADDLGTVPEPAVPWLVVAVVVPLAVLLLTNALAFVPGRLAARLRPATALRTE